MTVAPSSSCSIRPVAHDSHPSGLAPDPRLEQAPLTTDSCVLASSPRSALHSVSGLQASLEHATNGCLKWSKIRAGMSFAGAGLRADGRQWPPMATEPHRALRGKAEVEPGFAHCSLLDPRVHLAYSGASVASVASQSASLPRKAQGSREPRWTMLSWSPSPRLPYFLAALLHH